MKKIIALVLTALLTLSLAACGQKETDDTTPAGDQTAALTGTVSTDGSTSMEKVIGALSESFMAQNGGVTVNYNPTGSGSGITAVQEGTCDIGLSSRALKDEEKSAGLKETVLAYDGIAIIVHPDNPVSDLSIEQIAKLYTGEITNWKDVGGNDAQVVLIGREAASGTRDGFESITGTKDKCQYRQELTSTGDVITAVSQNPDAIGYASLASIKDNVKALNVDGVTPSEDTVKDGSYKVQRPFVLVTVEGKALSDVAQAFFDYATSADAAAGGGDRHLEPGLRGGGAQRQRGVLVLPGHRLQRRHGHVDHRRQYHHRQHQDGRQQAGAVRDAEHRADTRHQYQHAHQAVDHRRDARQQAHRRGDQALQPRRGHFRQKHGGHKSHRHAQDDGARRAVDTGEDKGQDAELRLRRVGVPHRAEQEFYKTDLPDGRDTGDDQIDRDQQHAAHRHQPHDQEPAVDGVL